jgi:hypothetical protein
MELEHVSWEYFAQAKAFEMLVENVKKEILVIKKLGEKSTKLFEQTKSFSLGKR